VIFQLSGDSAPRVTGLPADCVTGAEKSNKNKNLKEQSATLFWPELSDMRKTDQLQPLVARKAVEQVPDSSRCGQYYSTYSGFWARQA
jgi:hypothetical protein